MSTHRSPNAPRIEIASHLDPTQVFVNSLLVADGLAQVENPTSETVEEIVATAGKLTPESVEAARRVARNFLIKRGVAESVVSILFDDYDNVTLNDKGEPLPVQHSEPTVEKAEVKDPVSSIPKKSTGRRKSAAEIAASQQDLLQQEQSIDFSKGACKDADKELFFSETVEDRQEALRYCEACTIRAACLEYALVTDQRTGIWGGTLESERRRLKKGHIASA